MGSVCKKNKNILFTVDHHTGSEEHQLGEEYHDSDLFDQNISCFNSLPEFLRNLKESNLANFVLPIVADSKEISKNWEIPLGMVFIDGGHSRESAYADYTNWAPHIVKSGFLLIHDVFPDPAEGGQAPFTIWQLATQSGLFEPLGTEDTLRGLRRLGR